MERLNSQELSDFCNENTEICSKEDIWKVLLRIAFPDVYDIAISMHFPDLEESLRSPKRKFMPLRELYTQILSISLDLGHYELITLILNNRKISAAIFKRWMDITRIYYQLLSFVLSSISYEWKEYLVKENDIMVKYIPFTPSEMKELSYRYMTDESLRRCLTDTRCDSSEDANFLAKIFSEVDNSEIIQLALKRADTRALGSAIFLASENGHSEVVKLLLNDPRVDPSVSYNSAIRFASRNGHSEVVKLLLDDPRVDPSADDNEALRQASQNGHIEVVKLLLADSRVDPSAVASL